MIAQLVEQWTENPCVAGSTPARTTYKTRNFIAGFVLRGGDGDISGNGAKRYVS